MEKWNLSDCSMEHEYTVQLVFVMLFTQRFVKVSPCISIIQMIEQLFEMDEGLKKMIGKRELVVFDERGKRIDVHQCLKVDEHCHWVQWFVI